jgi:hypothetical protein
VHAVLGGSYLSERQTDCSPSLALERPVYRSGVVYEVAPRPWIAQEELGWQHIRLEPVARGAGHDDVARCVRTPLGQWVDVVECGALVAERSGAVDAAASTVSQGRELDRPLLLVR